eukprot:4241269-Amphidinium_carterae.2
MHRLLLQSHSSRGLHDKLARTILSLRRPGTQLQELQTQLQELQHLSNEWDERHTCGAAMLSPPSRERGASDFDS